MHFRRSVARSVVVVTALMTSCRSRVHSSSSRLMNQPTGPNGLTSTAFCDGLLVRARVSLEPWIGCLHVEQGVGPPRRVRVGFVQVRFQLARSMDDRRSGIELGLARNHGLWGDVVDGEVLRSDDGT